MPWTRLTKYPNLKTTTNKEVAITRCLITRGHDRRRNHEDWLCYSGVDCQ